MAAVTHTGTWTEADLADLPDDGLRRELLEGALLVNPPPSGRHQLLTGDLVHRLRAAAGGDLAVVEGLGVRVPGGTVLIPDIVVGDRRAVIEASSGILDPGDVALMVEVVSPSSHSMDRLTKPPLYAAAGIPAYWRVELEQGPAVHVYRLDADAYVPSGVARPAEPLAVDVPFAMSVEVGKPE
jgi:Uma2 family endonuclease